MSTNHTPNYNLSQWIKSDQVKMADFNADNAKIDTALSNINSRIDTAVSDINSKTDAAFTDINRRAGMKLIREAVLEERATILSLSLADIPWDQYGLVVAAFDPIPDGVSSIAVNFFSRSVGTIKVTTNRTAKYPCARMITAPMFSESSSVNFLAMGLEENNIFTCDCAFTRSSGGAFMTGIYLAAGSSIRIWGLC